jgi:hypothetical protein
MARLVCVAGATTGATGLIFDSATRQVVAVVKGLGILPLEQDENALYLRVQEICNSLAAISHVSPKPTAFVFGLSSHVQPGGEAVLRSAITHSRLGAADPTPLTWITRGEACWWASGTTRDAIILKIGTVGFAHAFCKSFPSETETWRAGGWGLLSGDDGGAYFIGRQVLYRLFEEQDGRRERTDFSRSFAEMMREQDTRAVTTWIRQHKDTHSLRLEVSRLAQAAIFLAEQRDDAFSARLLRKAALKVARCVAAVFQAARRNDVSYGTETIDLIVQGRLVQFSPIYARFLRDALRHNCATELRISPLRRSPVLGCLQKALVAYCRWDREDAADEISRIAAAHHSLNVEFAPGVERVFSEGIA